MAPLNHVARPHPSQKLLTWIKSFPPDCIFEFYIFRAAAFTLLTKFPLNHSAG